MELFSKARKFLMNTYGNRNIAFVKGEGCYLYDIYGNKYLDFISGIGVNALGHSHPLWIEKVKEQLEKVVHTSNLYIIPPQVELAEKLVKITFAGKVFFANSGTEAVEGAIKLARKYSYIKYGENRYEIIAMKNSFHGRTLGALSATGQEKYQKFFRPMVEGFLFATFNDFYSVEKLISEKTAAIILEPIQGEGGINPANREFLENIRKLCDEKDILLIFDEVQCGFGRTGEWYAFKYYGVKPDILITAKGLGNGIPIGAIIGNEKVSDVFNPGDHAHTFGGNFLSCASANATIDIIKKENILKNVIEEGTFIKERFLIWQKKYPFVTKVKGLGLMLGIDFNEKISVTELIVKLRMKGLLVNRAGKNTLRLLPPLNVKRAEIMQALDIIEEELKNIKVEGF